MVAVHRASNERALITSDFSRLLVRKRRIIPVLYHLKTFCYVKTKA